MRTKCPASAIAALLALALALPAHAQLEQEVVTVQVRPGVGMKYLGIVGGGQPRAAVILLAGGKGALKLGPSGSFGDLGLNFLIRSREQFASQGLYVAALDAASDQQAGMNGAIRLSPQHALDVGRVIAHLKDRLGVPVWVIGTSSGTLSTANVGARSEPPPHGIVLASAMTQLDAAGYCGKSVYDARLATIQLPVLVASHRDDGCECSPGSAAAGSKLLAALAGAVAKEHKIFTGGSAPISGPCDARAQHGFFGIEGDVVRTIADWIKSH